MSGRPVKGTARSTVPPTGRQGHYAGAVTRLVAFAVDWGAVWGTCSVGLAAVTLTVQLVTGHLLKVTSEKYVFAATLVVWAFVYFAYQWSLSGKTIGMALMGIRVVAKDGTAITGGQAVVRTLILPLSFLFLGLGFVGILFTKDRHAFHDRMAGTVVVYSWDARAARLRWLAKQEPTTSR